MTDLAPNVIYLGTTNPKIVIIPPSPRRGSSSEENETEPSAITLSGDDSKQSGNEFEAPDCIVLDEQSAEGVKDAGTQAPERQSECEKNGESQVPLRNITVETRFKRCASALASFNGSKCMLIFQFLLPGGFPVLAGFVVAEYFDKCPLSAEKYVFLFVMGITCAIAVIGQLLVSRKIQLSLFRERQALRMAIIAVNLAIIGYMSTEMFSFFWNIPSFKIGSQQYCDELFYKYTYWTIWICFVIVTFLVLFLFPNCHSAVVQKDKTK